MFCCVAAMEVTQKMFLFVEFALVGVHALEDAGVGAGLVETTMTALVRACVR
jgi:hypothetical protein